VVAVHTYRPVLSHEIHPTAPARCTLVEQQFLEFLSHLGGVFVLPKADDLESSGNEFLIRSDVAHPVPFHLLGPIFDVRTRHSTVFRTAVPEAAVDEHRNASAFEEKVGSNSSPSQLDDLSKSKTNPNGVQG
jgi:hypothetical protein